MLSELRPKCTQKCRHLREVCPLLLPYFNQNWNVTKNVIQIPHITNSVKIISAVLELQARRQTDAHTDGLLFPLASSYSSSMLLRPVFGAWPLRCQGLETVEFLRGEDVFSTPIPQFEGPVCLCPATRSKPVWHSRPYQQQLGWCWHRFRGMDQRGGC